MNCKESAKFLYAFADGELEMKENLSLLEHLNMCPACARKVNTQHQLKAALARVAAGGTAPESLRTAVEELIAREAGGAVPTTEKRPWFVRLWPPMAVAAVTVLVWVGFYRIDQPGSGNQASPSVTGSPLQGTRLVSMAVTDSSELARGLADGILVTHENCCKAGDAHHNPALPRNSTAAACIGSELSHPVLSCAGLSNAEDGGFVCANYCGVKDTDGKDHRGGHMIYRLDAERQVSLLSVDRLDEIESLQKKLYKGREYAVIQPNESTDKAPVTVVAFDWAETTHLLCAPMSPAEAVDLIAPMTLTAHAARPSERITFASLNH